MITRRKREPIRPKRIPIDLANIIIDLPTASIRILELQNRLGDLAVIETGFEGTTVVGGEVGFAVSACVGSEDVDGATGWSTAVVFALAAHVEVDGLGAVVADVGGAEGAGCSVDCGDGGAAGDKGGVGHVGVIGGCDWIWHWLWDGEGWKGEVAYGDNGRDGGG